MCASYNPPSESITEFNTSLFNQPEDTLSQAEADRLYLSKTKSDISTASSTTFNGNVSVGGNITGSNLIQNNTTGVTTNTIFNNLFANSTLTLGTNTSSNTINGNTNFGSNVSIKNKINLSQMSNLETSSSTTLVLTFPIAEVNTIRGLGGATSITIQLPAVTANETGFMFNFFKFQNNLAVTFTSSSSLIYTLNNFSVGSTSNTSLLSVDKIMTTLMCGFYGSVFYWIEVSNYSTFDRDYNNSIYPRLSVENNFSNRLNFSATSYSFPFASSQSLGYYLKTTGSIISTPTFVTATPTSIVSVTIPIGIWRIDFFVQNVVGSTGAGTISSAQSFISTTSNGAVAVAFTGSIIRSHVSEVYANNDVQVITSSFTYQQTTSGLVYLNIVRSFSTGQYNFTGELGITRIA